MIFIKRLIKQKITSLTALQRVLFSKMAAKMQ